MEEKTLNERIVIFLHKRYPRPYPQDEMLKMIAEKTKHTEDEARKALEEVLIKAEVDEVFMDGKIQYTFVQPQNRHKILAKRQAAWFEKL